MEYFRGNPDGCATAEEIYIYLMNKGQRIGKATVYRCLDRLLESRVITKFISESGDCAMYQLIDESNGCCRHFHLKCTECGCIIHMDCDFMEEFETHISQHHSFKVDNVRTVIYGVCEKCAAGR